jgi:hypothetical protein
LFTIFVGGPFYALSVVLVSVLAGYSAGSFLANKMCFTDRTFLRWGFLLGGWFAVLYLSMHLLTQALLPLPFALRLVVCALVSFGSSVPIGICVSSAMGVVRRAYGEVVSWMWGVSSIFNALGSICFIAITMTAGISSCLLIVAVIYLAANLIFASAAPTKRMIAESQPQR